MRRKKLINEITQFCVDCEVFDRSVNLGEIRNRIEILLNESEFIEDLINTIIYKAKMHNNFDTEKLKKMLLELEKIRLELEYETTNKI